MYRSHAVVYEPSKPSSLPSTDAWLKPTTSLTGLGEKLRRVLRTTQPGYEVESGALFLRSSSIHPTLSTTYKRLPRMETTHRKRTPGVHRLEWKVYVSCWSGFPMQGVNRFKSSWLSYMSNCLFMTAIK
jgi:hypothetical protein